MREEIPGVASNRILPAEVRRPLMDREHRGLVHPDPLCCLCRLSYPVSPAVPVFIHEKRFSNEMALLNSTGEIIFADVQKRPGTQD